VTARHNPKYEIGDLVHIELDTDGRLHCVAVLDDADYITDEGNLYFSPDYIAYGTGLREHVFTAELATITGLAVTPSPAGFAAKAWPLKMMRGDLRDQLTRFSSWPCTWRTSEPLLERAVEQRSHSRTPTSIVDRRPNPDAYPYPLELRRPIHRGAVWYGPPGRILSVR
jgi:hypothetical protein